MGRKKKNGTKAIARQAIKPAALQPGQYVVVTCELQRTCSASPLWPHCLSLGVAPLTSAASLSTPSTFLTSPPFGVSTALSVLPLPSYTLHTLSSQGYIGTPLRPSSRIRCKNYWHQNYCILYICKATTTKMIPCGWCHLGSCSIWDHLHHNCRSPWVPGWLNSGNIISCGSKRQIALALYFLNEGFVVLYLWACKRLGAWLFLRYLQTVLLCKLLGFF